MTYKIKQQKQKIENIQNFLIFAKFWSVPTKSS